MSDLNLHKQGHKFSQWGYFWQSDQIERKLRIFEVHFHIKIQCYWLSFMLVEKSSFLLQEFAVFCEVRFKIFTRKEYQKIQYFVEITLFTTKIDYFAKFRTFGDICGSRQSQINLFIYYFLLTKFNFSIQNSKFFQVSSTSRNETQNLGKAGLSFIGPFWKTRTHASFELKIVSNISVCLAHALSNIFALALEKR